MVIYQPLLKALLKNFALYLDAVKHRLKQNEKRELALFFFLQGCKISLSSKCLLSESAVKMAWEYVKDKSTLLLSLWAAKENNSMEIMATTRLLTLTIHRRRICPSIN